ncbi:MAG: hypothetical protein ACE5ID_11045 [Acidobacteriota bacterium]
MRVPLYRIAHARSGDKGDGSNVGLIAYDQASYELIRKTVTPARVKAHFHGIVRGKVERFEVPNLLAFNFLLHDSLGGGGSASLKNDAQGKTHGMALLRMEIEIPRGFRLPQVGRLGALAPAGTTLRKKSAARKTGTGRKKAGGRRKVSARKAPAARPVRRKR